eukprot:5020691-Amphidinium_carterae.1
MHKAAGLRGKGHSIEDLLCCTLLLGASALQVHASSSVRASAVATLQYVAALKQSYQGACNILTSILNRKHVCLEDLADLKPTATTPLLPKWSQSNAEPKWEALFTEALQQ